MNIDKDLQELQDALYGVIMEIGALDKTITDATAEESDGGRLVTDKERKQIADALDKFLTKTKTAQNKVFDFKHTHRHKSS